MLLLRFRLPNWAGIEGLERNDDDVSSCAGIDRYVPSLLEKLESHYSTCASDEGTVIAESVDVEGKKRPHSQVTPRRVELSSSVEHCLLSNETMHRHSVTNCT